MPTESSPGGKTRRSRCGSRLAATQDGREYQRRGVGGKTNTRRPAHIHAPCSPTVRVGGNRADRRAAATERHPTQPGCAPNAPPGEHGPQAHDGSRAGAGPGQDNDAAVVQVQPAKTTDYPTACAVVARLDANRTGRGENAVDPQEHDYRCSGEIEREKGRRPQQNVRRGNGPTPQTSRIAESNVCSRHTRSIRHNGFDEKRGVVHGTDKALESQLRGTRGRRGPRAIRQP